MIVKSWQLLYRIWHTCLVVDCDRLPTRPITFKCRKCGRIWLFEKVKTSKRTPDVEATATEASSITSEAHKVV